MKQLQFRLLFVFSLLLMCFMGIKATSQELDNEWVSLFNGKDLTGWKQLNGTAEYKVENGQIIGITKTKIPNSFLCTENKYGDFILEFDVMLDPTINSGVQFRSNSIENYKDDRVHGYQFDLDPSDRAFSGGIYDEARRGWIYPLSLNKKGSKAFKNGVWNSCRIEAIGNSIKTWINGVQCSNLVDDVTSPGFIALQVHSVGSKESDAGKKLNGRILKLKPII